MSSVSFSPFIECYSVVIRKTSAKFSLVVFRQTFIPHGVLSGIAFSACAFEVKGANASMATDSVLTADCLSYSCGFN